MEQESPRTRPALPGRLGSLGRRLVPALLVLWLMAGCAARRPPVLESLRRLETRTPVVLLPGITGSQLRHRESGKVLWGNLRSIFWPRDGGYSLALPIQPKAGEPPALEAPAAVTAFRVLGVFKIDVYDSLIRVMESNGYRLGDLASPRAQDTFFLFPYDWRFGNDRTAGDLVRFLHALRQVRGEEVLRVHLICQSNAARIARYVLKYGGASLEEVEGGRAGPPEGIRIDKLILVGTANGGALRTLHDLSRVRSYLPFLGRKFLPEVSFTYRSVYEELPAYRQDLFFDAEGSPLKVDLYDAENWKRYRWSVYGPAVEKRLRKARRVDLFAGREGRHVFLAGSLDRARRLHRALAADVTGTLHTRYYLIQNDDRVTAERAMLIRDEDGWRTVFPSQEPIKSHSHRRRLATAAGDGHATVASQLWLSPKEREALARPPVFVSEEHRRIILSPETHRFILEFLQE